jgi:outer membrane receptor protein involved in Fe transport
MSRPPYRRRLFAGCLLSVCVPLSAVAHEPISPPPDEDQKQDAAPGAQAPTPAPEAPTVEPPPPAPGGPPPAAPPAGPPPSAGEPPTAASEAPQAYRATVVAGRAYTSASSQVVRDRDFLLRPHPRPADILMTVPGMYVIQHAGGGKANQYFLRGFDSDHGTDVALSLDGVPINAVSHGHGQGYADLHFVIPELVERIEARKGPYSALDGDFATAGSFNLVLRDAAERNSVTIGGGQFGSYRGLAITGHRSDGWRTLLAGELHATDGPFVHGENLKRLNLFARLTRDFGAGHLSLTLTSYGAGWNASGQIPRRAVRAGLLDRFDSIDPTEGGGSQRHSAVLAYHSVEDGTETRLLAYAVSSRLGLYSNFTFFSRDPVNGDQINQTDQRVFAGLHGSQRWQRSLGGLRFDTTVGIQMRTDRIDTGLFRTVARKRIGNVVDAQVAQGSIGVFAQEDTTFTPWLRAVVGVRSDFFGFDVGDRLEPFDPAAPRTSGVRQALRTSPKASVVLGPIAGTELFLNVGLGFHSNDARGVIRADAPATPLTRALGYEVGVRSAFAGGRLDIAAAAFGLDLDSETVWVGDEGTTEARGPTRRLGVEAELRLRILPWLYADLDGSLVRATFTENPGNANAVALAPTRVASGGISAVHPGGVVGRIGFFHIGDRPATEDRFLVAEGFTRVDATLGYRASRYELGLQIQNLTATSWREAQFANVSRLTGETAPASCGPGTRPAGEGGAFLGCEDLHFTPGAPINVFGTATMFF